MSKQTAIEWLVDQVKVLELKRNRISNYAYNSRLFYTIEKAKAMEKEQIVDAVDGFPLDKRNLDGEQYYNETYGGGDDE